MATIEIDDEVYEALRLPDEERPKAMKQELAVALYARDILSFGKACALADLSNHEFQTLLGEREIPRHYTEEELAEDLDHAQTRTRARHGSQRRRCRSSWRSPLACRRFRRNTGRCYPFMTTAPSSPRRRSWTLGRDQSFRHLPSESRRRSYRWSSCSSTRMPVQ